MTSDRGIRHLRRVVETKVRQSEATLTAERRRFDMLVMRRSEISMEQDDTLALLQPGGAVDPVLFQLREIRLSRLAEDGKMLDREIVEIEDRLGQAKEGVRAAMRQREALRLQAMKQVKRPSRAFCETTHAQLLFEQKS